MPREKSKKRPKESYNVNGLKRDKKQKMDPVLDAVERILVIAGKTNQTFRNRTKIAEYVSVNLAERKLPRGVDALLRRYHTQDGEKVPNPYRKKILLYEEGFYAAKTKGRKVQKVDIEAIRKLSPAVDLYCMRLETEKRNLENLLKVQEDEINRLQGTQKLLPTEADAEVKKLKHGLNQTLTALAKVVDHIDGIEIDWKERAIVDEADIPPAVVVPSKFCEPYLKAVENSGITTLAKGTEEDS